MLLLVQGSLVCLWDVDSLQAGKYRNHTVNISSIWFSQRSTLFLFRFKVLKHKGVVWLTQTHTLFPPIREAVSRPTLGLDTVQSQNSTTFRAHLASPVVVFPRRSDIQLWIPSLSTAESIGGTYAPVFGTNFDIFLFRDCDGKFFAWTQVSAGYVWNDSGICALWSY